MPTLAEIQSKLRDVVVRGCMEDSAGLRALLVGGSNPEKRLTIHQRNYHRSLVDALLVKFPATAWLVGTPFLMEAAKRFVIEQPPEAPCIAEYGAAFPDFLSRCPGAEGLPYLCDFAELEWCLGKAAIAVDDMPVSSQQFSAIDPQLLPDMLLTLQSGLYYIHAAWPVDELMKLYLTETAPDRFEFPPAEAWIEVRGARGEFHWNRLDAAEYTFRKSVSEGHSIGDAAGCALEINARFDPGEALAGLIAAGLITTLKQNA
jgi:hypothetical protein